jgi:6-phosphogluconate dehydrogenase
MQIGVIGLGRMGGNITRRLMQNGQTIMAAIEEAVPADVLSAALYPRFRSRRDHTFAEKILSAMRKGFGAHVEPKDRKAKPS